MTFTSCNPTFIQEIYSGFLCKMIYSTQKEEEKKKKKRTLKLNFKAVDKKYDKIRVKSAYK